MITLLLATALASAPSPEVLDYALSAHRCAVQRGVLEGARHPDRLVLIDYSLPSTERRLWVLDVDDGTTLLHEHVAHGQGTGDNLARAFSNEPGSHQTSLGVFRTAEVYQGSNGLSLKLDGLEPGVNDLARERAIVIHGAPYVNETLAAKQGRLGRSWGCPAVRPEVTSTLIDAIAGGTLLVAWYPDPSWMQASAFLAC